MQEGKSLKHDITRKNYNIPKKSSKPGDLRIENSDEEIGNDFDESDYYGGNDYQSSMSDDYNDEDSSVNSDLLTMFGVKTNNTKVSKKGVNDDHMSVAPKSKKTLNKVLFGKETSSSKAVETPKKSMSFLNLAKDKNIGFNDVCASMQKFAKVAKKQNSELEARE